MNYYPIFGIALLAGCASSAPTPDWQMNADSGIERAVSAYLSGNDRIAAQEFALARSAINSTGKITLAARAELIRCASRVASLVLEECSGFAKLAQDAPAPERAYARYLAGQAQPQDIALLPPQHQRVMQSAANPATAVAGIDDPLARLVAAGVLLRSGRADPAVLALAVDTASAQGWRRPLLAWLGVQALRAEQAGADTEVQRLHRRMDLVQPK